MQIQFEPNDIVTLRNVTDFDADEFGLGEDEFEALVDSQHNDDEFVVEAVTPHFLITVIGEHFDAVVFG